LFLISRICFINTLTGVTLLYRFIVILVYSRVFVLSSYLSYLSQQLSYFNSDPHHKSPGFRYLPANIYDSEPIIKYVTGTIFTVIIGQWIRRK